MNKVEIEYKNMEDNLLEDNALDRFRNKQFELEQKTKQTKKKLKVEREHLKKLSAHLHLTKQQIEFFTQETHRALEGLKDANWQFTKEVCNSLSKLKSPNASLLEVCDKFMLILEQQDRSWKTFQAMIKNYSPVKSLMASVQTKTIPEDLLKDCLPLWKQQESIYSNIQKFGNGACLLAEWVSYAVEHKLKFETLNCSKKNIPKLEKKLRKQKILINKLNSKILILEEKIFENDFAIRNHLKEDLSERMPSVPTTFNYGNPVSCAKLQGGTASGGIMQQHIRSGSSEFPNFDHHLLYQEIKHSDACEINYEGTGEVLGCCRLRFFCY